MTSISCVPLLRCLKIPVTIEHTFEYWGGNSWSQLYKIRR